jgi:MSHA biogenesis protein MshN
VSLINKMLQDLETRNTAQVDTANKKPVYEDLKPLSRAPAPRASSRRLPLMLLVTVAVVGAAGYAWTQWGDSLVASLSSDKFASKPTPVVARKVAAPKPRPAPVPAPAPAAVATVAQTEVVTPPALSAPAEKPAEAPVQAAQAPVVPPVVAEPKKPETISTPKPVVAPTSSKVTTAKQNGYWMVSRGDTLYGVSVQTGVDVLALSRWNNLGREHVIYPGQRLRLTPPAKETAALAPAMTPGARKSEPKPAPVMASSASVSQGADSVMDKRVRPFSPNEKAESEYRRAANLLQKGRMADAEKHLRLALSADAAHTPARELLAGLMLQQGHWREAQELLEQGIGAVPAHYPFAQLLARVHVEHGADHKALAVMEGSRRAGAENSEYVAFLAALYQRAGKHAEAVKTYSEAVTLNPQEGRWWLGLGISLEAVQDRNAAGAAYQRAINSGVLDDKLLQYARQRLAIVKK